MFPTNQYTDTPIERPVILFDLDGTLIDSTEAILESFRESYRVLGGAYPGEEAVRAMIGHPLAQMYRSFGAPQERIEEYVAAYKAHYRSVHTQKTVLLPGAKEAVVAAARFARLGVVTTKTGRYSRELLEHFGIMEHFDVLVGSEDVTRHKPHPEPILTALEWMECRLPEAECWMIGDTCMDLEAARAAGVHSIGVLCGYGSRAQLAACGERLVADVGEAVTLLHP